MFTTIRTLFDGANVRAENQLRDRYAIELIDQKIHEAQLNLNAAKQTLASLIQRKRAEVRLVEGLDKRVADLTERATEALKGDREDLATQAATAIADMENERTRRQQTVDRLETRIVQLQGTVEAAHRRIIDLKQGAITARAIRREQTMQTRLNRTIGRSSAADEAEDLIKRVTDQDDPFEESQILKEIETGLTHGDVAEKLADEGFGDATKASANAVLDRLKKSL